MYKQRRSYCSRPVLLLATLDVKNAFNSLRSSDVLNVLEYNFSVPYYILAIISSYLSNRQLIYNTSSGPRVKHITSGAVQRSIPGHKLWNVNYDEILREFSDCIRRWYCSYYHGQEHGRATAKTKKCYAKNENIIEFPWSTLDHI